MTASTTILEHAELTEAQFQSISQTVRDLCGINLHTGKKELVKARLAKRLRALGMSDFGQYLDYVQRDASGDELATMLDLLSTNLTYFFREPQHLAYLRATVLPEALERHRVDRRLRIWSAGCSSGEEPYSIAITLMDAVPDLGRWNVAILATDLSTRVLRAAREGVYPRQRLRESPAGVGRYLLPVPGQRDLVRVHEDLRKMVQFARLNLMGPWPMKGPFDVIFCRNVMIYFDKPTQARLVDRFWEILAPGGTLFIGHSESLAGVRHRFEYAHPTVYRKP